MIWGSAENLLVAAFITVFLLLAWTSAWLSGRAWFIATVGALAGGLSCAAIPIIVGEVGLNRWLGLGGLLMSFLVAFYFVGMRYITQTRVRDMTYHSHEALVQFIDENGLASPFARIMRRMGPALLVFFLLFGVIAAWGKITGALK